MESNEMSRADVDHHAGVEVTARLNDEVLDQPVRNPFTGYSLCVAVILLLAFLLRILRLDAYLLGPVEGRWAGDSWAIFTGSPVPGPEASPDVSPLFQVLNAASFFLFGDTDATARIAPALMGFGIVVLVFAFRPFVSRSHLAAMALLAAVSPTLVFASRTVHPAIAVAFFTLLTLVALLRAGVAGTTVSRAGWSLGVGLGLAGMLASGVDGVTALLSLAIGIFAAAVSDSSTDGSQSGSVRAGLRAVSTHRSSVALLVLGFVLATLVLFSRVLTDFTALSGIVTTFGNWGRLMMSRASSIPSSFFFWALLLYEILAIVFAIMAIVVTRRDTSPARRQQLSPVMFGAWFFASLLLHSLASGREVDHAVLVALPLVLLAGLGLGDVLARIDASGFWHSRLWGLPVMLTGVLLGLAVTVIVVGRAMDRDIDSTAAFPTWLAVLMALTVILVTAGAVGALLNRVDDGANPVRVVDPVLIMVAVALGLFTMITTAGLAYERADDGTEMLARNVPSEDGAVLINRINQVSRDLSVENRTNIDPTGRYGLRISVSPDVAWPFAWYFRDYPFMRVLPPAGWNENLDVAIATTAEGMETYGLTPQESSWVIRSPRSYSDLDAGDIFGRILQPDTWGDALRYLVSREVETPQEPQRLTVGYSNRVGNQLNPNFGPFDLFTGESPGVGNGLGQLNQPAGIGVSPDGSTIYVLNAGNQRIDRFQRDGTFIGVWDGAVDPVFALSWNVNQGGTGLTVGEDGLIYIADTWNHVVIVADESGTVVRQLGQRGVLTDTTDAGLPSDSPGLFFGPRGVAVTEERIFVTDTGNERVQVFSRDGTFITAFGGFGTGQGQLIEPTGIVIGPDGNVWVADSGNARIQVFTIEGEFVEEIPVSSWQGQMGVDRLNALAVGPDGVVYLTSPLASAVEAWDGEQMVTVTNVPPVRAGGITVAPDGNLLVTDVNGAVVHDVTPQLPEGFGPDPGPAAPEGTPTASPIATPANG
ncbi:MAG TPA: 6-bladed beta-propeller [Thermomicrobiales bacterium]|nr:6-bladed beta-propeller [Thermomicrobiales bacterium]